MIKHIFKNIMSVFDYSYYRMAKLYFKWDGKYAITSVALVSLMESMLIIDVIGLIYLENYSVKSRLEMAEKFNLLVFLILTMSFWCNKKRYEDKYDYLSIKWKEDSTVRTKLKGILVFLLLIGSISFLPIILNVNDYTK